MNTILASRVCACSRNSEARVVGIQRHVCVICSIRHEPMKLTAKHRVSPIRKILRVAAHRRIKRKWVINHLMQRSSSRNLPSKLPQNLMFTQLSKIVEYDQRV